MSVALVAIRATTVDIIRESFLSHAFVDLTSPVLEYYQTSASDQRLWCPDKAGRRGEGEGEEFIEVGLDGANDDVTEEVEEGGDGI